MFKELAKITNTDPLFWETECEKIDNIFFPSNKLLISDKIATVNFKFSSSSSKGK